MRGKKLSSEEMIKKYKMEIYICENCGWKGKSKETCTDMDGNHLCPKCEHEVWDEGREKIKIWNSI